MAVATHYNMVRVPVAQSPTPPPGVGTVSLASVASGGFLTPAQAGVPTLTTVNYKITDGTLWEIGTGVYTLGSPSTLTRAVVEMTSDGTLNKKTFTATAIVHLVASADNIVTLANADNWQVSQPFNQGLTAGGAAAGSPRQASFDTSGRLTIAYADTNGTPDVLTRKNIGISPGAVGIGVVDNWYLGAPDTGTYTQSGTLITITISEAHDLADLGKVRLFLGGPLAGTPDHNASFTADVISPTVFTVTSLTSRTITANAANTVSAVFEVLSAQQSVVMSDNYEHPENRTAEFRFYTITNGVTPIKRALTLKDERALLAQDPIDPLHAATKRYVDNFTGEEWLAEATGVAATDSANIAAWWASLVNGASLKLPIGRWTLTTAVEAIVTPALLARLSIKGVSRYSSAIVCTGAGSLTLKCLQPGGGGVVSHRSLVDISDFAVEPGAAGVLKLLDIEYPDLGSRANANFSVVCQRMNFCPSDWSTDYSSINPLRFYGVNRLRLDDVNVSCGISASVRSVRVLDLSETYQAKITKSRISGDGDYLIYKTNISHTEGLIISGNELVGCDATVYIKCYQEVVPPNTLGDMPGLEISNNRIAGTRRLVHVAGMKGAIVHNDMIAGPAKNGTYSWNSLTGSVTCTMDPDPQLKHWFVDNVSTVLITFTPQVTTGTYVQNNGTPGVVGGVITCTETGHNLANGTQGTNVVMTYDPGGAVNDSYNLVSGVAGNVFVLTADANKHKNASGSYSRTFTAEERTFTVKTTPTYYQFTVDIPVWLPNTDYVVGDLVRRPTVWYCCKLDHLSAGTFSAANWYIIQNTGSFVISETNRPFEYIGVQASSALLVESNVFDGGSLMGSRAVHLGGTDPMNVGESLNVPVVKTITIGENHCRYDGNVAPYYVGAAVIDAEVQKPRKVAATITARRLIEVDPAATNIIIAGGDARYADYEETGTDGSGLLQVLMTKTLSGYTVSRSEGIKFFMEFLVPTTSGNKTVYFRINTLARVSTVISPVTPASITIEGMLYGRGANAQRYVATLYVGGVRTDYSAADLTYADSAGIVLSGAATAPAVNDVIQKSLCIQVL